MATKELRELRHKYKAAYTDYMSCVQALSDASQKGDWPSADTLYRCVDPLGNRIIFLLALPMIFFLRVSDRLHFIQA